MTAPLLVIGNKRYSSWSLRGWIALRSLKLDFREHRIFLFKEGTREEILRYSPSGRVPVLVDGELTVFDSMAIMEYASERYGSGGLLPGDQARRARVRAVCAEMHSGFPHLRESLPMNLCREPSPLSVKEGTALEIERILGLWQVLREEHRDGGAYLFGSWSMADCMYLPVVARFHVYGVDMSGHPLARAYAGEMLALPAFQEWWRAAEQETEVLPQYEI